MDCTDVIMASFYNDKTDSEGLNTRIHIEDMYTRDRSTPLNDKLLDGEESFTAVYARHINSRTVLMFRRPIRGLFFKLIKPMLNKIEKSNFNYVIDVVLKFIIVKLV